MICIHLHAKNKQNSVDLAVFVYKHTLLSNYVRIVRKKLNCLGLIFQIQFLSFSKNAMNIFEISPEIHLKNPENSNKIYLSFHYD